MKKNDPCNCFHPDCKECFPPAQYACKHGNNHRQCRECNLEAENFALKYDLDSTKKSLATTLQNKVSLSLHFDKIREKYRLENERLKTEIANLKKQYEFKISQLHFIIAWFVTREEPLPPPISPLKPSEKTLPMSPTDDPLAFTMHCTICLYKHHKLDQEPCASCKDQSRFRFPVAPAGELASKEFRCIDCGHDLSRFVIGYAPGMRYIFDKCRCIDCAYKQMKSSEPNSKPDSPTQ